MDRNVYRDPSHPLDLEEFAQFKKLFLVENALGTPNLCDAQAIGHAVQKTSNTYPELLELFAQSRYSNIRFLVAGHPNTPCHVLEKLEADAQIEVIRSS